MFLITTSLFALLAWASSKIEDDQKEEELDEISAAIAMFIFAIFAALFNTCLWNMILDRSIMSVFEIFIMSFLVFILLFLFSTIGILMLGKEDDFC